MKLREILDNQHMKVASLFSLRTGCLYTQEGLLGTHFCYMLSRPQGQSFNTVILIELRIYENIITTTGDEESDSQVLNRWGIKSCFKFHGLKVVVLSQ